MIYKFRIFGPPMTFPPHLKPELNSAPKDCSRRRKAYSLHNAPE